MKDESTVKRPSSKREELQRENAMLREQMAIIANSIEAIDRVLETFGFQGELDDKAPRAARVALFYRGELRAFLLARLREADRPLSSRELAVMVSQTDGKDARDRRMLGDITRRVGTCLRKMRAVKAVQGYRDKSGAAVWTVGR